MKKTKKDQEKDDGKRMIKKENWRLNDWMQVNNTKKSELKLNSKLELKWNEMKR